MADDRQRYRHAWRCRSCGDRFHTVRLTADPTGMSPRCPKRACGGKSKQSHVPDLGMDVAEGKAPGVVGANVQTRAYDSAMQMTMTDQGLTDIQDHSRPGSVYRPGEGTAPKLPTHLQQQADTFWGGANRQKTRTAKADLSPIFGQQGPNAPPPVAHQAPMNSIVEPILKHKPRGSSAVPDHVVIAG